VSIFFAFVQYIKRFLRKTNGGVEKMHQFRMVGTLSDRPYYCHKNFKKETFCFNTEKIIAADDKKNIVKELDIVKNNAILNNIGCESLMYTAGVASVSGGDSLNNIFTGSVFFEPVGRTLCGVAVYTSLTPAGSFFVPDVRVRGKILAQNPYTQKVCYDQR
jgi:hypothetical protein